MHSWVMFCQFIARWHLYMYLKWRVIRSIRSTLQLQLIFHCFRLFLNELFDANYTLQSYRIFKKSNLFTDTVTFKIIYYQS